MRRFTPSRKSSAISVALFFSCLAFGQARPAWLDGLQSAVAQMRSGDLAGATKQYDQLWSANSTDATLAVSIGASLDSAAHHEEAAIWYQRALVLQPDNESALMDMALNYAARGQLAKAAPLLRKVVNANPGNARAAYNLGLVDLRLRRYTEAAELFRKAGAAPQPPAPPSQIHLAEATALFHAARYSDAVTVLANSGERDATHLLLLGSAQALANNLPASIATFQEVVRSAPENPQGYYRLALALLQGGRTQDAREVLDQGQKRLPGSALLLYAMTVLEDRNGNNDAAEAWVQKSLAADKNQSEAWALLGSLYAGSGRQDQALPAYQESLRLGPNVDTELAYAELLIRSGHASDAEMELRTLAQANHDDPRVERVFGRLYRAQRNYEQAESYFRRAIQLNPNDADAHFGLAESLRFLGRRAEAEKEYAVFMEKKKAAHMVRLLEVQ